jgi:energy-coupling factor transport system substrate-specific component
LEHTSVRNRQTATIELAKAAMFTSAAVGAGFALAYVPNIELITAIVFAAGVYLGLSWGSVVGAVSMLIFSGVNPMGSGFINPPLVIAQVISMVLIAATGGLLRSWIFSAKWTKLKIVFLGIIGGLLTFIYDSLTTLSTPFAMGFEEKNLLAMYLAGIGFTILHQISNIAVFSLILPGLFSRVRKPS